MKVFFTNLLGSFFYDYSHYKRNYLVVFGAILIGILIGVILIFSLSDIEQILDISNKNYINIMHGTANLSGMFLDNLGWFIIVDLIIIVFSMSSITFLLGNLYIVYQSVLAVLTIGSVVRTFGFVGIVNSLLLVLPFNLLNLVLIGFLLVMLFNFFSQNKSDGISLFSTVNDKYIYLRLVVVVMIEVIFCFMLSYVVPFLLKSLVIVSF